MDKFKLCLLLLSFLASSANSSTETTPDEESLLQEMLTQVRDANHGLLQQADRHRVLAARLDDVESLMQDVAKENELMREKLELQQIKQSKRMHRLTAKLKAALHVMEKCSCSVDSSSTGDEVNSFWREMRHFRKSNKDKKRKKRRKKNKNHRKSTNNINKVKSLLEKNPTYDNKERNYGEEVKNETTGYNRVGMEGPQQQDYRPRPPSAQPNKPFLVQGQRSQMSSEMRILVTAGSSSNTTQVLDLSHRPNRRCASRLPSFPIFTLEGAVATFEDQMKQIMVCGGRISIDKYVSTCHTLSEDAEQWSLLNSTMREPRYLATATWIDADQWWITGGFDGELVLQSTEIYRVKENRFKRGPDLPKAVFRHCLIKVNATHVFIGGGYRHTRDAWLMEQTSGASTPLQPVPRGREAPHCAQYLNSDGSTDIMMAGALSFGQRLSMHIYSVENNEWRVAKAMLPNALVNSAALQIGNGGLVLVGGQRMDQRRAEGISHTDQIMRYDAMGDEWVRERVRLISPTSNFVAIVLPNNFACSKREKTRLIQT